MSAIRGSQLRKCLVLLVSLLAMMMSKVSAAAAEDDVSGVFRSLKESYDELPPTGKFISGAGIGYAGTRFAVNRAVGVAKFTCAAFITSEALHYAGVLERIPKENMQMARKLKQSVVNTVDGFRVQVRRSFRPDSVRDCISSALTKEKLATLGFASGVYAACVL